MPRMKSAELPTLGQILGGDLEKTVNKFALECSGAMCSRKSILIRLGQTEKARVIREKIDGGKVWFPKLDGWVKAT